MLRNVFAAMTFALVLAVSQAHAQWGTLTGQFIYDGKAPAAKPLVITKDVAFCGKHGLTSEKVVANPANGGLANIGVWLYLARGKKAPTAHPDYQKSAPSEVRLDNENCRFEPHFVTLRTSQTLVIGNKDPVGHNTKVDAIKNIPINPIVPANGEIKKQFPKEERLPTLVSCSIHPWMSARVLIKNSPYMAVSDKDGKFRLENMPVGKWTIQAWHENGYVVDVKVDGKKTEWKRGRFDVTINDGENDLGEIRVAPALFAK